MDTYIFQASGNLFCQCKKIKLHKDNNKERNITEDQLIEGAISAGAAKLVEAFLEAKTRCAIKTVFLR